MNVKRFLTDRVTLLKKDGTAYENVEAGVQSNMIFITDASLPVEVGDKTKRLLPSGGRGIDGLCLDNGALRRAGEEARTG